MIKSAPDRLLVEPTEERVPNIRNPRGRMGDVSLAEESASFDGLRSGRTREKGVADALLYQDTTEQLEEAAAWLSSGPDNFLVRITGGCLHLAADHAKQIQTVLLRALEGFDGALVSGGTEARERGAESSRPCMPELGALLQERRGAHTRHLAVIPGDELGPSPTGQIQIDRDRSAERRWSVLLDQRVTHAVVSGRQTEYLWDAEWQTSLELVRGLRDSGRCRGAAVIGFDGGTATEREYRAWTEAARADPNLHVILVTGGGAERATDRLARSLERAELPKNVHVVGPDPQRIRALFERIGAFIGEGRDA